MINQVNLARPLKNQHSLLCENHVLPKTVFTKYNKKIRKWVFGGSEREALKVKTEDTVFSGNRSSQALRIRLIQLFQCRVHVIRGSSTDLSKHN